MRGTDRPDVGPGGLLAQLDRYPVTWGVVLANLLVFSVAYSRQQGGGLWISGAVLDSMGATAWPELRAQPWRLLTGAFLHVDPLHLVLNLTALHSVGRILEVHLGSARLWVLYVAFAVLGGLTSAGWLALHGGGSSVGASNAVIGLLAFGWTFSRGARDRLGSLEGHFGRWLAMVLFISFILPGVDVAGHAGGALAGGLAGLVVRPRPGDDPEPAWIPTAHALAILVLGAFGAAGRAG